MKKIVWKWLFLKKKSWRIITFSYRRDGYTFKSALRLIVDDDVKDNSIVNFPIQATASDGFKLALLDLDQKLEGLDARIVHIIHDEIIVEAREDIVDDVSKLVKECMEKAYEEMLPNCPFLVEPKITDTWG